jgi:hypothetical protein
MPKALAEPASPLTVTVDSRLADDYLLVSAASVAGNPESSVCLAASPDGTLLYHFAILAGYGPSELQPSTTVAGGLIAVPLPAGDGATEIVGFVDSDGSVHACYATSQGMVHVSREQDGQWPATAEPVTSPVSGLTTASIEWTQQTAITAVTSDGNLLLFAEQPDGSWQANTVNVSGALGECNARLAYTSPDDWILFAADSSGPLQMWQGSGTSIMSSAVPVQGVPAAVANVWFTHHQGTSPTAIFSDVNGALYSSSGFGATVVKAVKSSDVRHGSGMIDAHGHIQFFGADGNGTLWVLHQTHLDDLGAPHWAPIFQLDTDVNYVTAASGAVTASATTMAFAAVSVPDGSIDLITQPGAHGLWSRAPVQLPPPQSAPFPLQTNRYRTRLAITDANGLPCPGVQLTVMPSELVGLEVAGTSVAAPPGTGALLTADPTGTIEFSQIATGLEAVTFSVTGQGITAPVTVTPHQYLHEQLAGSASIFTGSATIPPMSAQTLQQAGSSVFPNLVNQAQADAVASASVAIFNVLNGTVPQGTTGYSLDLSNPQAPVFAPISSSAELAAAKAALGQTAGGLWDDIGHFFGDVLHGIEQGALAVVKWTIDVAQKTISITVQISDEVQAVLADLAFDTVSAAISLVHSLLNWLGAAVAAVLNWLKDLLPWGEIWSQMETFDGYVIGSLQAVTTALEHTGVVATGHFFSDLKTDVDNAFEKVIAWLGDQPLRPDYGPKPISKPVTQPPGSLPGSSATNNWVKSKMLTHVSTPDMMTDPDVSPDFINQIIAAIQESGIQADIAAEVENVQRFLAGSWGSAQSVSETPAAELLAVIQGLVDVVLDALDALVIILIELIGDMTGVLVTILNTPLPDIPLLSWLWEHVLRPADNNDEMTLSKLICLAIAAPVVLIGSLADQSAAADAGDTMTGIREITSAVLVLTDMVNDAVNCTGADTTMLTWLVNVLDVAVNLLVQTLFWPIGTPMVNYPWDGSWDWTGMSLGDQATNGTWIAYYVPILIDGACTVADFVAMKLNLKGLGELMSPINITLDVICGAGLMGGGIFGAWLQAEQNPPAATGVDIFEAIVGPMPWATQFLIVPGLVEDTYGGSALAQLVIDFIGDWDWSDMLE